MKVKVGVFVAMLEMGVLLVHSNSYAQNLPAVSTETAVATKFAMITVFEIICLRQTMSFF